MYTFSIYIQIIYKYKIINIGLVKVYINLISGKISQCYTIIIDLIFTNI